MVNNLGLNLSTEGLAIYLSIPQSAQLSQNVTNMKANWKMVIHSIREFTNIG